MSAPPLAVFIVDDEAPARQRLVSLLEDITAELPNHVVGQAGNGVEALARLAQSPAQVVLVDIRMPAMDGIELAGHLRRLDPPPAVVFVTAYDQYAVQAFELSAVDYLLKPVRAARLAEALRKARVPRPDALERLAPAARRFLSCSERGTVRLVPIEEVLCFKAELKYVTARTARREYIIEDSLNQLEREFADRLLRVHRNCLVARGAIAGFERGPESDHEAHWQLLLHQLDERIPVSRRQWPAVKAALAQLTGARPDDA